MGREFQLRKVKNMRAGGWSELHNNVNALSVSELDRIWFK